MLSLTGPASHLCDGMDRREILRLGGLSAAGLSLPALLARESAAGARRPEARRNRRAARSCVLFFLEGGPSHIDLWDMKPEAPEEIRGEFRPIRTTVPGVTVCELLPMLSQQMHRLAQVRSVTHRISDHNAGTYYALTGRYPMNGSQLIQANEPTNFPPYGSVLSRLRPTGNALPDFIHLPEIMSNLSVDIAGQGAGFLGSAYEPFVAGDPSLPDYEIPGLNLANDIPLRNLGQRRALLQQLDRTMAEAGQNPAMDRMNVFYRQAMNLITSEEARRAFDLTQEPMRIRDRYGMDHGSNRAIEARHFGGLPHLGQCLLLTRRLIEAGVRLVTVVSGRRIDQAWDTHRQHFPLLRRSLCPAFDRGFSAFLEDMAERGLLEDTLIVVMGEFGRTPRLGQIVSGAGAERNGRDHWPFCYTVFFAGAGIRGGRIYGSSDRRGAYPSQDPVSPEDLTATIYEAMGIPADTEIHDPLHRPHRLITGRSILDQLTSRRSPPLAP